MEHDPQVSTEQHEVAAADRSGRLASMGSKHSCLA